MAHSDSSSLRWPTRAWLSVKGELNFYRIHLIYFTVTPLIFSGIFYASNGHYHISYIDSLYNCFSSMCVCGLATVNLSTLTAWQQTIMFIQMCIGNPVFVSWFMVLVRRHYFARKFKHVLASQIAQKYPSSALRGASGEEKRRTWSDRILTLLHRNRGPPVVAEGNSEGSKSVKRDIIQNLRPDMIRRMDDAPMLVNPSGWVTEGKTTSLRSTPSRRSATGDQAVDVVGPGYHSHETGQLKKSPTEFSTPRSGDGRRRGLSDPGAPSRPATPTSPIHRHDSVMDPSTNENQRGFSRHQTIEFAPTLQRPRGRPEQPMISEHEVESPIDQHHLSDQRSVRRPSLGPNYTINTQNTTQTQRTTRTARNAKHRDFGGFPMPHHLITSALYKMFPRFKRRLTITATMPATTSLISTRTGQHVPQHAKGVSYFSFNAIVGRNSIFHFLTKDQMEELGGVEYRALNALLWLVAGYFFGLQLICFTIIGPYISTSRWSEIFQPPNQVRPLSTGWFALFQVVSSFSNTGSSLVDESMIPFQKAYTMAIFQMVLVLGGNCAYPILLRLLIWFTTKIIPRKSRLNETLNFLLDHPRRCYTYLFPSHQTWFLLTLVFVLTFIDWFFFMLLDIGNSVIEEIPLNTRFAAGLFQAVAVRAAGFAIVPMNSLAPAVKVLYTVMMYISIYPIALSIRSSNVYEERSLGIFDDQDDFNEENFEYRGPNRVDVWSRYLAMHVRRQLAFDMWWLSIAIFLICIIERPNLDDPSKADWFNVFNIIFEVVSAYGTVGLSLGITGQNFSLSGAFRPLSKLIVCAVILRGRHRSLPVAIDRAILLPSEDHEGAVVEDDDIRSHHTQPSQAQGTGYNPHARYSRVELARGGDEGGEGTFQRQPTRRRTSASSNYESHMPETRSRPASSVHASPIADGP